MLRRISTSVGFYQRAAAARACAPLAIEFDGVTRRFASDKPKNPYKVLGLPQGASVKEIKKAHRVMTRKFHPDVPGGSHDKFQEIQDAYEQIKTGVWIKKGGDGGSSGGGEDGKPANRYANFRFTQGGRKSKKSYEDVYSEFKQNKRQNANEEDIDEEAMAGGPRRPNPFGPNDVHFQAWCRLIGLWTAIFIVMRVSLFFMFPPKHEKPQKKKMSARKPPPPKPLAPSTAVLT